LWQACTTIIQQINNVPITTVLAEIGVLCSNSILVEVICPYRHEVSFEGFLEAKTEAACAGKQIYKPSQ
jgi:hypothetical protein